MWWRHTHMGPRRMVEGSSTGWTGRGWYSPSPEPLSSAGPATSRPSRLLQLRGGSGTARVEAQCSHLPVSQLAEVGRVGRTSADVVDPETTAGWAGRSMPASGDACSAATPVRPHDSDVRKRQETRARQTISTSPTECSSATAARAMRLPTPGVPHRAGRLLLVRIPRAQPWPKSSAGLLPLRASSERQEIPEEILRMSPLHSRPTQSRR